MRRINTRSSGLSHHMTRYNMSDAKMDNPHLASRELPAIVRNVNTERDLRYRPLRSSVNRVSQ